MQDSPRRQAMKECDEALSPPSLLAHPVPLAHPSVGPLHASGDGMPVTITVVTSLAPSALVAARLS
jgi:hypothetical protein